MKPILLGSFGLAIASLLPSCVATYPQGPGQPQVATSVSVGYEARTLPSGYRTEIIGGTSYYIHNNTYYRPRSGRYVVVEAPRGYRPGPREVYIDRLPPGYRVVRRGNQRYYYVNNRYYQQRGSRYLAVEISAR
ncbi:MAG: DUF6515 family protein [Verrucomicrobiota bacterium]